MPISAQREIFEIDEIQPTNGLTNHDNLFGVDLAFAGHDSQYSLHALHPYVAAINPPLVRKLIDTYVPLNENIIDPYAGGGGVLLEATLNNRSNAGGDINPLSVILSKAKTTHIAQSSIEKAYKQIMDVASTDRRRKFEIDPQLEFWFKKESIPQISALIKGIDLVTVPDSDINNLFKAIFSATVRDVMLTYRGEVRLRKLRDNDLTKFTPDVFRSFKKRYGIAHERIVTLPVGAKSDIQIRDIKNLEFENESFHSTICSPPYADDKNGVGYFQFSKNMLEWLGYTKEQISNNKKMFLGANKVINELPESETLSLSLENVKKRSSVHYVEANSFYYDYDLGLKEMCRVTRRYLIIVIGNRVLSRTQFDNAQITVDFMRNIGVNLKHHYTRELRKKRIANMGGDGGGIAKEHILVFEK
jgi:site-specific DNA-methyltransferase (cytosine-N4-specific)